MDEIKRLRPSHLVRVISQVIRVIRVVRVVIQMYADICICMYEIYIYIHDWCSNGHGSSLIMPKNPNNL